MTYLTKKKVCYRKFQKVERRLRVDADSWQPAASARWSRSPCAARQSVTSEELPASTRDTRRTSRADRWNSAMHASTPPAPVRGLPRARCRPSYDRLPAQLRMSEEEANARRRSCRPTRRARSLQLSKGHHVRDRSARRLRRKLDSRNRNLSWTLGASIFDGGAGGHLRGEIRTTRGPAAYDVASASKSATSSSRGYTPRKRARHRRWRARRRREIHTVVGTRAATKRGAPRAVCDES